jgi:hypothetical protein
MRILSSLALVLAMTLPYGQSWLGLCAMARPDAEAVHACPHHRPEQTQKPHCHSESKEARTASLTCNCGSSGHDGAAASAIYDRFGLVEAGKQVNPGSLSAGLERYASPAPDGAIPEPPTPPPRFSSRAA